MVKAAVDWEGVDLVEGKDLVEADLAAEAVKDSAVAGAVQGLV